MFRTQGTGCVQNIFGNADFVVFLRSHPVESSEYSRKQDVPRREMNVPHIYVGDLKRKATYLQKCDVVLIGKVFRRDCCWLFNYPDSIHRKRS